MTRISTHVLDVSEGCVGSHIQVLLEVYQDGSFQRVGSAVTDNDGRVREWEGDSRSGEDEEDHTVYRLTFDTKAYYEERGKTTFYPYVQIVFTVADGAKHYHVPLLLSPYGYSTYRGS